MRAGEDERVLSVAALGRPFRLGMLYDSRSEKLIPGITLWDQTTLEKRTVQQLETSDFHVLCSDSLDDKASALEVDASLKLSFMGGLVDIQGAAKYLDNRKNSINQERVTLQYKCTTKAESMTMEQLGQGKVQHPEVFDHGTATHVVTSIVYGAQGFFIFDRHHSSSDHDRKVGGNVRVVIEKIPTIKINGKGELNMSQDEKEKTEQFTCRFFGDFLLRQNPTSFSDAVKLYQKLPKLLGTGGENAVPIKVQLYPLTLIDRKAIKLVREISINLISETENFFEEMHELNMKCKDILKTDAVKSFLAIQNQMQEFINLTETYKRVIQKELSVLLPRIRGGGDEERCLVDLLNKMHNSPVSLLALRSWLQTKNTQVKVLNEYIRAMADIKFATEPGDLESIVMSPENTYCLCLTISLPSNDFQLDQMKKYCHETRSSKSYEKAGDMDVRPLQINSMPMMEVAGGFRDFYNVNKTKKGIAFLVAQEFSDSDVFHARVKCYKHGRMINDNYGLTSAPEKLTALVEDTTHKSITVSWSPPKYGASFITSYVVSCCKEANEEDTSRVTVDRDEGQVTIPGLAANTEYEVRVCCRCEVGDGPVGDTKVIVKTKPASKPEMPRALKVSSNKILLKWQAPTCVGDGCSVEEYIIKQEMETGHWEESLRVPSDKCSCNLESFSSNIPRFKVAASCGSAGLSCDSEPCSVDLTKPPISENLKQYLCANSLPDPINTNIYKPELRLVLSNNDDMIEKYEFGEKKIEVQEKVVMLVGATGSGKTTLINGFINYIFGIEWKDSFRFKMIVEPNVTNQAMSQTTKITSYTIHHLEGFRVPYTLTIIDTPGFGDVSGIMRDREITENIRKFFTKCGESGITHIDAVGFVANSSLPRLTPTQRYIFEQILSLFGKDIADNIFLFLTFADGKRPQVLSGIKEAKIQFKKYFKFNNSALYALYEHKNEDESDDEDGGFDTMFWDMGFKSFSVFLDQLTTIESKSLVLTQDVLNERNRLQIYIAGIQKDIRQGLTTLERLKKEKEILEKHSADIERNKTFWYEVDEEVFVTIPIPTGQYVTNCLNCNRTCHEYCKIPENHLKKGCWVMTGGYCRICPNKCIWSVHKNFPYKYELEIRKVKKTVDELRQRYQEASKKKLSTENLIEEVNEEFNALKVKVLGMTHSVRMSLQRLQEIALRPNPMTTVQYLDVLMENEKSQALPGWQARLEQLRTVKKEAEYMEMIAKKGFDPFKQYSEKLELKMIHSKNNVWAKVFDYFKK
ncbi:Neoverrucotoxin subunit beta [Portunus trituberculatus]|uniref:Neoverrucotoxin subunit beta n=1 Tax=Portunus trituberculatus TaxID=210409 RepID=A0A5B7DZM0_PORTR|nr:Neoverrucotoxin subunit beta [Portunus trituberculatus]